MLEDSKAIFPNWCRLYTPKGKPLKFLKMFYKKSVSNNLKAKVEQKQPRYHCTMIPPLVFNKEDTLFANIKSPTDGSYIDEVELFQAAKKKKFSFNSLHGRLATGSNSTSPRYSNQTSPRKIHDNMEDKIISSYYQVSISHVMKKSRRL